MSNVHMVMAVSEYDHVRDLTNGRVVAEGIDLTCLSMPVLEIFYRFVQFREWDISEVSLAKYVSLVSQNDTSMVAIPVFPSRIFRHSSLYVRRDGPVKTPADLAGKRIGIPEWAQTAVVYGRGLLAHEYSVDLASIEWIQAGVNEPGRIERMKLRLPTGINVTPAPNDTLSDLLVSGGVDALITAHVPACFEEGHPNVARLFEDYMQVETEYYRKTKLFPIMHVVVMRRDVFDRYPWAAMNLLQAFEKAKERSIERALNLSAPRFPIPWCYEYARRAQSTFGKDYWPYGVEPNRPTLEAFLQYCYEQGVCHRRLAVDDLFPREVMTRYKV